MPSASATLPSNDVLREYPVENHHILRDIQDYRSVKELPESYAWSTEETKGFSSSLNDVVAAVPVIDLTNPNAMKLIGEACREWGVFQVTNHGISFDLLHRMASSSMGLFNLPLQQKLKAARPPTGLTGYGLPHISPFFHKSMWFEGFSVLGSPLEHARQLWPNDPQPFCDVVGEFNKEMKTLAANVTRMILGSMGIPKEEMKWAEVESSSDSLIQFNHYPACPEPDRAMGLVAHTDSSLVTFLYQSSGIEGLQVQKDGVGWVTVTPIPEALVVNVGDLIHILSNGIFNSVVHRAMVNRENSRYAIGYFYGPPTDTVISPFPSLISPTRPAVYPAVTWSEYIAIKAKLFNKALPSLRLSSPTKG